MLQQPPAGKPWAAGKDAAERSKLFCTFVAAGNFLPEIKDADAIAANAAHSDKAISCCQRQRGARLFSSLAFLLTLFFSPFSSQARR